MRKVNGMKNRREDATRTSGFGAVANDDVGRETRLLRCELILIANHRESSILGLITKSMIQQNLSTVTRSSNEEQLLAVIRLVVFLLRFAEANRKRLRINSCEQYGKSKMRTFLVVEASSELSVPLLGLLSLKTSIQCHKPK